MITRASTLLLVVLSLITGMGAPISTPAAQIQSGEFAVEFFPVAPYHVGDILSARVTYTGEEPAEDWEITVALADEPDQILLSTTFSRHNRQAIFYWIIDTADMSPGFLSFQFNLPEAGLAWTEGVHLLPDTQDRTAAWAVAHSPCCTLHYLTGTDAAADLPEITAAVESRSALALAQFDEAGVLEENPLTDPLPIVLIPVVVGHGGFATDEAVLTYSHYNWTGINFEILAHHEIVHVIDRTINTTGPRPAILAEGLAVYLSGGHYREGDALERAAALLDLGLYLPITDIVNDFYAAQHEIGYMQAAALVAYLDRLYSWETVIDFYFTLPEGPDDETIISTASEARFSLSLAELEADMLAYLGDLDVDPQVISDVRLTIETYDMLRRYQTLAIPSAHFRSAWWPHPRHMRLRGIVGDYAYREKAPLHALVEHKFIQVHAALERADYARAEDLLGEIAALLTRVDHTDSLFLFELGTLKFHTFPLKFIQP
ncbi:MAG: hypothetical protein ACNA70_05385 [Brevefilum sp.]